MGSRERREKERTEMKERIRQAALALIQQEGYQKLSMRKLAARIDYSPTTLYLYYKDKGEIIADMADCLAMKMIEEVVEALEAYSTAPTLVRVGEAFVAFLQPMAREPEMAKAVLHSGEAVIFAPSGPETPSGGGLALLEQLLEEGIQQGCFHSRARGSGWMLVSALLGFGLCSLESGLCSREGFREQAVLFVELLLKGIACE